MKSTTATTILAALTLGLLATAAPVDPDSYDIGGGFPPYDPSDLDHDGIPDWKETIPWVEPPNFPKAAYGAPPPGPFYPPVPDNYKRDAEAHPPAWGPPPKQWGPPPNPWGPPPNPWGPPAGGPNVCSGNNNVAACCNGGDCAVVPQNALSGLLGLNLGIGALNQACSSNQQINCCEQNGGGLINLQSCGSLLDIL
ncbi:hypothetical protein SLS56_006606 [Neofusicoccum ribis]|uniref:Hydrophobin n=1 Tax=Neofusicoccum ribis TaxID=45134 RepID=A0ABR3SQC7_9PEZI